MRMLLVALAAVTAALVEVHASSADAIRSMTAAATAGERADT
jgi:hypothetical protein